MRPVWRLFREACAHYFNYYPETVEDWTGDEGRERRQLAVDRLRDMSALIERGVDDARIRLPDRLLTAKLHWLTIEFSISESQRAPISQDLELWGERGLVPVKRGTRNRTTALVGQTAANGVLQSVRLQHWRGSGNVVPFGTYFPSLREKELLEPEYDGMRRLLHARLTTKKCLNLADLKERALNVLVAMGIPDGWRREDMDISIFRAACINRIGRITCEGIGADKSRRVSHFILGSPKPVAPGQEPVNKVCSVQFWVRARTLAAAAAVAAGPVGADGPPGGVMPAKYFAVVHVPNAQADDDAAGDEDEVWRSGCAPSKNRGRRGDVRELGVEFDDVAGLLISLPSADGRTRRYALSTVRSGI